MAQAQAAEVRGDHAQAMSLLNKAAEVYERSDNPTRAEKMRRHVARLEAQAQSEGGSAKSPGEAAKTPSDAPRVSAPRESGLLLEPEGHSREGRLIPERGPTAPDLSVDAWCSFCCRPNGEVGALVGGPTGSFICVECVSTATGMLPLVGQPATFTALALVPLTEQVEVRRRLEVRGAKATLLLGPEGVGKSALLHSLGPAWSMGQTPPAAERLGIDLSRALTAPEEETLLQWLERGSSRQLLIATRGALPDAVMTLQGAGGAEAIYSSDSVWLAIGRKLSPGFIARIEAFFAIAPLGKESLAALGKHWLAEKRDVSVPLDALARMAELAEASGRGAHELRALIGRVPKGAWSGLG